MEQCKMMSAREIENKKAQEKHLEECRISNFKHMDEIESKRRVAMAYVDTKAADFWETKKRNTQKLRDKAQQ
jgi:hypothetical protein